MSKQKRNIRPWVVMFCMGLISAACLGSSMVLMGSFLAPLSQSLHTEISTLSYYYTVLVLAMAVMTPNVPKILAKVNNRILFAVASLAVAASLFLMPHFTNVWMFFLIAIVIGVAISFMSFTPVGILLDNWFSRKAGFAIGLCWAITSVFQGIMSPILSVLINKYGWEQSLTILAIIVAVLSIPCALFGVDFSPEQEGRKPYGYGEVQEQAQEDEEVKQVSNNELFKSATFWLLLAIVILLQFPAVLNQMFPTYAATTGFNAAVGGFMVTAAMLFDIFLNPLVGSTCDKYGAEKASLVWMAISVVSYVLLIVATNTHSANLAIFSAGVNDIFYVYLGTGITTIATAVLGKRAFAKGFSYVNSIAFLIGAFAMPVNNMIAEKFGGFNAVYIFFAVITVLIIVLIVVISKHHFEVKSN
ncbi:MFS transporter [Lactobacillus sp. ESL0791]|uniref:MFS transporter n=1 Tax=Lactobacillus sp. ESL0791 TaxID=2983234 RepID=UPI0023F7380E|nr:MFS transporter [Lactobacillus sp. ESL0791]MDF7638100.1 MFS transporter [Lactobacillus sp. ESL0791]